MVNHTLLCVSCHDHVSRDETLLVKRLSCKRLLFHTTALETDFRTYSCLFRTTRKCATVREFVSGLTQRRGALFSKIYVPRMIFKQIQFSQWCSLENRTKAKLSELIFLLIIDMFYFCFLLFRENLNFRNNNVWTCSSPNIFIRTAQVQTSFSHHRNMRI